MRRVCIQVRVKLKIDLNVTSDVFESMSRTDEEAHDVKLVMTSQLFTL